MKATKFISTLLLLAALQSPHDASGQDTNCWAFLPLSCNGVTNADLVAATSLFDSVVSAINLGRHETTEYCPGIRVVAPRKANLTWSVEIAKTTDNFAATVDKIGTETGQIIDRQKIVADSLDKVFYRLQATFANSDAVYDSSFAEHQDDENAPKTTFVIYQPYAETNIDSRTTLAADQLIQAMTDEIIKDSRCIVTDRTHLDALTQLQDWSASGASPYRIRTDRFIGAKYVISPVILAGEENAQKMKLDLVDTATGEKFRSATFPLDERLTGQILARSIACLLE